MAKFSVSTCNLVILTERAMPNLVILTERTIRESRDGSRDQVIKTPFAEEQIERPKDLRCLTVRKAICLRRCLFA